METTFATRDVGSLHRVGSLKTVSSESPKCNLDVVAVQEVRWGRWGGVVVSQQTIIHFSMEMGMLIIT
jgi:hypothetical protein